MDNDFNNTPDNLEQEKQTYKDPNADYNQNNFDNTEYNYYQPNDQYQQNNYNQGNFNYNNGNNMGYNGSYNMNNDPVMDTSPMSMGDWVLTILALMIPCAGIIIYFVWAFGKKGNVNRRNYCRAYLIIYGVILVIYLIIMLVFGAAMVGSM